MAYSKRRQYAQDGVPSGDSVKRFANIVKDAELAKRVQSEIGRRRLTNKEAAQQIGVAPNNLCAWLADRATFGPDRQAKVRAWLG